MTEITLKKTTLEKKAGTKTAYKVVKVETEKVTEREHQLTTGTDTLKWFRRLGGSEHATRSYTCAGYAVTQLISTSPDRQIKIRREYTFKWVE
jgi:hypothetical protein